jgi:hypothetical protein
MVEHSPRVPFDDRPALEELERLQRSIQEYRRKRERAEGEFEKFVGGFRPAAGQGTDLLVGVPAPPPTRGGTPPVTYDGVDGPPVTPGRVVTPAVSPVSAVAAAPPMAPPAGQISQKAPPAAMASAPSPLAVTDPAPPGFEPTASAPPPAVNVPPSFFSDAQRSVTFDNGAGDVNGTAAGTRSRIPVLIGGAVLIVAGVLVARSFLPAAGAPATPPAPAVSTSTPAAVPPESGTPAPAPSPAPTPAAGAAATPPSASGAAQSAAGAVTAAPGATPSPSSAVAPRPTAVAGAASATPPAEVRTIRRAWLRVVIDGNRAVEREVEANTNIPLPAGHTFVVRAGDAGAVHFFLNGRDQGPLGADAQVVTRTFTAAGSATPAPAR